MRIRHLAILALACFIAVPILAKPPARERLIRHHFQAPGMRVNHNPRGPDTSRFHHGVPKASPMREHSVSGATVDRPDPDSTDRPRRSGKLSSLHRSELSSRFGALHFHAASEDPQLSMLEDPLAERVISGRLQNEFMREDLQRREQQRARRPSMARPMIEQIESQVARNGFRSVFENGAIPRAFSRPKWFAYTATRLIIEALPSALR